MKVWLIFFFFLHSSVTFVWELTKWCYVVSHGSVGTFTWTKLVTCWLLGSGSGSNVDELSKEDRIVFYENIISVGSCYILYIGYIWFHFYFFSFVSNWLFDHLEKSSATVRVKEILLFWCTFCLIMNKYIQNAYDTNSHQFHNVVDDYYFSKLVN